MLHFFYDAQFRTEKVSYNGVIYTYIHNSQGDIVALLDNSGTLVVEYKYDVWARLLSITGSLKTTLGLLNPFRYRSYIYDELGRKTTVKVGNQALSTIVKRMKFACRKFRINLCYISIK